jgi:hypothetical protein
MMSAFPLKTPRPGARALLGLMTVLAACIRHSPLPLTPLQTPEQLRELLGCTPQRDHGPGAPVSTNLDEECDMKMDALLYLQAAKTAGRFPDGDTQRGLGISIEPQGFSLEELGSSVEFRGFEVINPLRGPHLLRARLSSGVELAFCCGKLKAHCQEQPCTCSSDCNGE